MGWPNDANRVEAFGASLRLIARLGRSAISVRFLEYRDVETSETDTEKDSWSVPTGTIDVGWRGKRNGDLMLLLAHLLHRNTEWRDNRIRLLRVIPKDDGVLEVKRHLDELCSSARIAAETVVLASSDWSRTIRETSANAAIVLIGFYSPKEGVIHRRCPTPKSLAYDSVSRRLFRMTLKSAGAGAGITK